MMTASQDDWCWDEVPTRLPCDGVWAMRECRLGCRFWDYCGKASFLAVTGLA